MKNYIVTILTFLLFSSIMAQEESQNEGKFYFGIKTGYTIPVSNGTIGSPRSEVGNRIISVSDVGTPNYKYSEKNPFGTRGAGFTLSGNFGYMITENFGVEQEFSFLRSSKNLDASVNNTTNGETNYYAMQHSYTNMLRAATMMVVRGNPNKKFVPYAKIGILLPLAGKTIVEVDLKDKTGVLANNLLPVLDEDLYNEIQHVSDSLGISIPIATDNYIKAKTAGAFSIGFASRIGCEYNINKHWAIYGELEMNMLTVKAKETKFVDFKSEVPDNLVATAEALLGHSVQGTFTMDDVPEILRLTVYQDEITEQSNTTFDPAKKDQAFDQITFRDNYNSFGLLFGFKYKFGKN